MISPALLEKINKLPENELKEIEHIIDAILVKQPKEERKDRKPGFAKGMIKILPGFDDPIEGLEPYM